MPRPCKCRFVCKEPANCVFNPEGEGFGEIIISLDEYEVLRLIDLEGCNQEECAGRMRVARTTVQSIYSSARQKVADALVNSKRIIIGGGDVTLCPKSHDDCGRGCGKNCHHKRVNP